MIRIDSHAHVFSQHDQMIENARYTPTYDASLAQFLAHLDEHAYSHAVLVQPSFFGHDNHVLLNAIQQAPQRLKGIAVVDKNIELTQLVKLKQQGIVGIRLNLFGLTVPDFTQPEWVKLLQHLTELDFQLELHAPPKILIHVLPILNHYPINIVIDHFGRIDVTLGINDPDYQTFLTLLNPKQHWIKVSGYYRLGNAPQHIATAQKAFALLKAKGFLTQMIWGSDWPHTQHESLVSYHSVVDSFQQIVPDLDEQALILGQNAATLFFKSL
ncbi:MULTISPECIES: amidohydrolase family protein [unclassified Acinetobacter]|uniref:amidohydrolase family protein n=1 Tax=unclassified Acinetobacter TaxID=196816 RepID=UPI002934851E|nr:MULTISPECIES: amidohydrolase family protein [unclassified Acinetobacter]WOE31735.1 amidohydrolase family protein [Acinetobacter sp. SAAs470]WOE37202.1 amidohydrolase family protein [Acinetobacter sp. SAAs474]